MALKERGIAVTGTVRKGASEYSPRLLQLKKVNRGLVWGALQASIIEGICCWLWQDSNAVMGMLLFFFSSFFFISLNSCSKILKIYDSECCKIFLIFYIFCEF
jgi:hypothetical protein